MPSTIDSPAEVRPAASGTGPESAAVPPYLVTLGIVAGALALLLAAAAGAQVPVQPIAYRFLGLDFNDFWTAGGDLLAGRDPYLRARFVTPPLSSLPFLPLAALPRPIATAAFFGLDLLALALGVLALVRAFGLGRAAALALALTCALSPSSLMLVERGNIDGLVFAALCGFFALGEAGLAGPLCLAVATCLKLYPAVLIPALLAQRRVRAAAIVAALLAASLLAMPAGTLAFLHHQVARAGAMKLDENISALAAFWMVDEVLWPDAPPGFGSHPAMAAGALLYAAALATCLRIDARLSGRLGRADRRLLLASYAGFCIGMPSLVYLYSGVCLLIPLAALAQDGLSLPAARLRGLAIGIGVAMVPAKAFSLTLGPGTAGLLNALPPLGCLLVIAAAVRLRVDLGRVAAPGPA